MRNKWQLLHDYRRLVRAGEANPILCPDCSSEYIPVIDNNDEPVLWCPSCDCKVRPGIGFWDQIDAAIKDANRP